MTLSKRIEIVKRKLNQKKFAKRKLIIDFFSFQQLKTIAIVASFLFRLRKIIRSRKEIDERRKKKRNEKRNWRKNK